MIWRFLLIGVLFAGACEESRPQSYPPPTAAEPAAPAAKEAPLPAAEDTLPKPEPAHGLKFRIQNSAAKPLDIPTVGQLITAHKSELIIDLEDGTRIAATPHARLLALAFAPSLVLVSGKVHIARLPDAARAGLVAARIATWLGAFETSPGADATLEVEARALRAQHPDGDKELRAQLQLERGGLTFLALDQRPQQQETQLIAGAQPPKLGGLSWLQAGSAFDAAFLKLPWVRVAASQEADRALDAALSEQELLRERGHELLASVSPHHAALAKLARDGSTQANPKRDSASTREYQRALVEHAQRSHAHAAQLLLAAERSLLLAILACGDAANTSCAALQLWSERFSARCASLL